jgi:hypothetical protein
MENEDKTLDEILLMNTESNPKIYSKKATPPGLCPHKPEHYRMKCPVRIQATGQILRCY